MGSTSTVTKSYIGEASGDFMIALAQFHGDREENIKLSKNDTFTDEMNEFERLLKKALEKTSGSYDIEIDRMESAVNAIVATAKHVSYVVGFQDGIRFILASLIG